MEQVKSYLKQAGSWLGLFLQSNWAYIIWFFLHYFLLAVILQGIFQSVSLGYFYAGLAYVVSMGIALSPVGEFALRMLQGAHEIRTGQDCNYLMPLFEEVYQDALEQTPSLSKGIKLYISEEKTINGYAMGRKTIVLTRGAIETFHREDLKGILAHEFGHMANGDTKALLMSIIGNGIFSLIILGCKIAMWLINFFVSAVTEENFAFRIVYFILRLAFDYSVIAFMFVGNVVLSLNSRHSEYLADDYAFQIGYGEGLKCGLYLINTLDIGGRQSLKDGLLSSHPHTPARIGRLEQKLEFEAHRNLSPFG